MVVPRAVGLDVHKMQITATKEFNAQPIRLDALAGQGVTAAAMEGPRSYCVMPARRQLLLSARHPPQSSSERPAEVRMHLRRCVAEPQPIQVRCSGAAGL